MRAIYYDIYEDLRDRIIAGEYPYQSYIPSENQLVERYQCSHNTLRKAQTVLRLHGFTQPIQGKGVKVIWQRTRRADFVLGEIETFKEAAELLSIQRVRYLDDVAVIYDHNHFLEWLVPGLTPEIVTDSIYAYLEGELGMVVSTSNRIVTVEFASPADREMLDLLDFNMVAVITGHTFNEKGIMFEHTISRHRPDYFTFCDTAVREY